MLASQARANNVLYLSRVTCNLRTAWSSLKPCLSHKVPRVKKKAASSYRVNIPVLNDPKIPSPYAEFFLKLAAQSIIILSCERWELDYFTIIPVTLIHASIDEIYENLFVS